MEAIQNQDQRFSSQQISSFLKKAKNGNISSKKGSEHKRPKRKKKLEDISNQISLGLKYENFEQETELFYPQIYRKESVISIENVSLLDQSHFRFLVNQNSDIFNHYSQYKQNNFSNITWKDIEFIYFYCNDNYTCPICLESKLCCPIITKCGHVFCFPCIISLYKYHMNISINKKIPNCPLCSRKLIYDDENIKFNINENFKLCQKMKSINYNNNAKIKFNLILRDKKSPTLYNLIYDPLLENWKNNFKNKMKTIPDEQTKEFNFSRIFASNKLLINKRLNEYKKELNILKEEFDLTSDELKKESINESIKQIDFILLKNKNENSNDENSLNNNKDNSSQENDKNENNKDNGDIDYKKYFLFYQEEKGDIYYLHPFLMEILLTEYEEDYNSLPIEIEGNILDIEMNQVTPKLKSEYKYLNHLRIGSIIFFVEIDINDLISSSTKKLYNDKIYERNRLRNLFKNQEKSYENFIKRKNSKLIEEEKNNSLEDSKKSLDKINSPIFFGTDEELGKNDKNENNNNKEKEKDENIKKKGNKLKMLLIEKEKEEKEVKDKKEEKDKKEKKEKKEKKDKNEMVKKEEKNVKKNKKGENKNKKNKGGKKGKKSENNDIKEKVFNSNNDDESSF